MDISQWGCGASMQQPDEPAGPCEADGVPRQSTTTISYRSPGDSGRSRASTAVAGYDLTFSPVKSVSTPWAVADPATAATIERAHQAAIKDALGSLQQRAQFTRLGANGVRQ
jgi:hypothetical protein